MWRVICVKYCIDAIILLVLFFLPRHGLLIFVLSETNLSFPVFFVCRVTFSVVPVTICDSITQASSDPGRWATPGLFAAALTEVLGDANLGPVIGARTLTDVMRVRLFSHSGGYQVLGR